MSTDEFDIKTFQSPLTPRGQLLLEELYSKNYPLDGYLLTGSAPLVNPSSISYKWLFKKWEETYKEYGKLFEEKIYFAAVASRGPDCANSWSLHVVLQEKPTEIEWFTTAWRKFGANMTITHHQNTLRYFVKNCMEPGAEFEWGAFQKKAKV